MGGFVTDKSSRAVVGFAADLSTAGIALACAQSVTDPAERHSLNCRTR